ncbi:MAG: alpha/beta fold hydrolase [Tsuneonella sp.]
MIQRREVLAGGFSVLAGLAAPALALPEPAGKVRRDYLDGPFGQIHVRIAGERGKSPPLVLLHQTPLSGRMFERIMPALAHDRLVVAVDTPGYGESDRPAERPSLAGYGDAILAALRPRFGRRFDLMGYHTGAVIAADLAARTSAVRRLVLVSFPLFGSERRATLLAQLAAPEEPYADDGSHLLPMWKGTMSVRPQAQSVDDAARLVAEKLRPGRHREWALRSAMERDLAPMLAAIRGPTLAVAPHDGLQDATRAAARLVPGSELADLPDAGYGLFDAAPAALAGLISAFLNRR